MLLTCRRAFALENNPDANWSSALYRGLNYVQYTDGRNVMYVNRDDAAGFRLDTMSTHRLQGKESLTTQTDFVNYYPSLLPTSLYNFAKTGTTVALCAGIVKASGLYSKNAAQHAADIKMLEELPQIYPNFNSRSQIKIKKLNAYVWMVLRMKAHPMMKFSFIGQNGTTNNSPLLQTLPVDLFGKPTLFYRRPQLSGLVPHST